MRNSSHPKWRGQLSSPSSQGMYLLYLDESGNESDPSDKFFVLGGAAVFERVTFFLSQALESVQTKHFPGVPPVEFHTSPIRTGKGFWRNIPEAKRLEVLDGDCPVDRRK